MSDLSPNRNTVFISYSHDDRRYLAELCRFLAPLEHEHQVQVWADTTLRPGDAWREEIERSLTSARVAILLVSGAFRASKFIADNELPPLLAAAKSQGVLILPVYLGHCDYSSSELAGVQAIPDLSKPLNSMPKHRREAVWVDVARRVKEAFSASQSKKQLYDSSTTSTSVIALASAQRAPGSASTASEAPQAVIELVRLASKWDSQGKFHEALDALDHALAIYPNFVDAWIAKGGDHLECQDFDKALAAFDRALALDPDNAKGWVYKGVAQYAQGKYEEAISAYERAIALSPNSASIWSLKGDALHELGRHADSLADYMLAISLEPNDAGLWTDKGVTLFDLARYEESLDAYDQALSLDNTRVQTWAHKGAALRALGRGAEASAAMERARELGWTDS